MKKRYKLLIMFFISFCLSIFVYIKFYHRKSFYYFIGDDLNYHMPTYSFYDYLSLESKIINYESNYLTASYLLESMEGNTNKINYHLKNANLVIMSLGAVELNNYVELSDDILHDYIDTINTILAKTNHLNKNFIFISCYNANINAFLIDHINRKAHILNCYDYDFNPLTIKGHTIINYQAHKKLATVIKKFLVTN